MQNRNQNEIQIREAALEDAAEIARVHLASWRVAYRGVIHQSYLDHGLDLEERTQAWTENLQTGRAADYTIFVACDDDRIIGFADVGAARDDDTQGSAELYAIYLHPNYFDRGIGRQLFQFLWAQLQILHYVKLNVWVLESNQRGRQFYERMGARLAKQKKKLTIDEHPYREVMYEWDLE